MSLRNLAIVQGVPQTRAALARWNRQPLAVVGPWVAASSVIAVALLLGVYVVAGLSVPDTTRLVVIGVYREADAGDVLHVLARNLLVLTLHAMACVAGFIAGSALPREAASYEGRWRELHERAGPAAIAFVGAATIFSLCTQAYVLGNDARTLGAQLGIDGATLMLTLLPHALPELIALFLPLAAWIVASRRGLWDELLAATVATVALALPVLVMTACIEAFVWPRLLMAASPVV